MAIFNSYVKLPEGMCFFSVLYCETKNFRVEVWGDGPTDCTIRLWYKNDKFPRSFRWPEVHVHLVWFVLLKWSHLKSPFFLGPHSSILRRWERFRLLGLGKVGVLVLERSGTWAWLRRLRFQFFYIGMHASIHRYIYIHILIMMVNINHNIIYHITMLYSRSTI